MSDLQTEHYRDLLTYHGALKQFLSVSNAPTKSNPKRAAKAREKLLKLSATQFYELSTDVYDELERRIDESRDEPDFLLPKSTFHPKRNEAREKLGSLQQGRFRDLVSDIHYEIERREYHIPQPQLQQPQYQYRSSLNSIDYANQRSSKNSAASQNVRESDPSNKNGVVSLQSTTVIPTKAELAWSSDEEEEGSHNRHSYQQSPQKQKQEQHSHQYQPSSRQLQQDPHFNNNNNNNHRPQQSLDYNQQLQSRSNRNSDASSKKRNSNVSSDKDTLGEMVDTPPKHSAQVNRGLSLSKTRNKDREIELLLEEGTKMDQTITQLEQKIALLQSKSDKFENETKDLKKINQNLNNRISTLEEDLLNKDAKLKDLEQSQRSLVGGNNDNANGGTRALQMDTQTGKIDQTSLDELKKEVLDWRTKFEDLKLQKVEDLLSTNSISEKSVSKLLDNNGLIPISIVNLLHKSIESILLFLNKEKSFDGKKIDVNALFDHISKISNISGKIASFAPQSDKSELIRASISHAITSTRYFALYSEFLPKLVVESAVSEIAFSVCDLISDVKLNKDDSKYSASEFEVPNNTTSEDIPNEISPVRPLRMTKKSFESPFRNEGSTTTSTPRPLNLAINKASDGSPLVAATSVAKKPYQGLNGLSSPVTSTKKMEFGNKISPSSSNTRDLNASGTNASNSTSNTTTPVKKNGALPSSLMSRYSPESERRSPESNTPAPSLRKSSSSNILSKVRQFEEQGGSNSNGSVSPAKSVSPYGKSISGLKRSSVESQQESSSLEASRDSDEIKPLENLNKGINKVDISKPSSIPEVINVGKNEPVATNGNALAPAEAKRIDYNDDDEDDYDLTSVDQLKGAIKKDLNLKSKIVDGGSGKPIVIDDDEEEEDLNQLPSNGDDDLKTNNVAESRDSKLNGSRNLEKNGDLKIERKQLNEVFIEPSNNLNNDGADVGATTGLSKSTEPLAEKTMQPLNLKNNKKESSAIELEKGGSSDKQTLQDDFKSAQEEPDLEPETGGTRENDRNNRSEGRDLEEDFDVRQFDIEDPDNTLSELLLYLEHQTVKVISTIQTLLTSIKAADSTKGELRSGSRAINAVVSQMVEATSNSMNQSRNGQLREHGIWVVQSLEDSGRRMDMLCNSSSKDGEENEDDNGDYADKHFKQRLAGIAFDVAKCTKELVKTVEEANLKEEIEHLDARLGQ